MIAILTDSTCDIPDELIKQYDIRVVPQYIIWGVEQFRDRVDMQPIEFYERLIVDAQRPTTSQATSGDFGKAIQCAVEDGATQAMILTVSSAMSGTYEMASRAAKDASISVRVIDSKGPTMTLGWQVLAAARAREKGATFDEIIQEVEAVRGKMVQVVAMQTLDYLHTGGRIGDAAKWVGSMLNVKPIVNINHQTGRVAPLSLVRTHKALVRTLYKKFFDMVGPGTQLRIAVLHGNALTEAQALAERIRDEFNPEELLVNITGPVLGINTGPGALALCGYAEGS
ncbi:MAG: DegV family protein [Chloroflexota bacterium]|nr:DegV family protein [Chloroflexota bacterium]